ncbi:sigma-70 family RNA polymerase sigma factor [Virgibacillus ihumii]|uniref:sigma-70 family RNA polymerase sigma factor n=1 Tax=Virgibacillus ihumii TaxID=2686091 RepID=UPI00157E07FA|nr:sigma-70 family RNA polymerase sigma factor [Virgibacillus ihumii]
MDNRISFEEIFEQNKRRIHFQIHKLNINDPHEEFFQEGLIAMWNAYEKYQPDKGPMATYFNCIIRNRLIDHLRKETTHQNIQEKAIKEELTQITEGNHHSLRGKVDLRLVSEQSLPLTDPALWKSLKSHLTERQWKWIYYHIIEDMSYTEIAVTENTTVEAVKSWGKQVRMKLRDPAFREKLQWEEGL